MLRAQNKILKKIFSVLRLYIVISFVLGVVILINSEKYKISNTIYGIGYQIYGNTTLFLKDLYEIIHGDACNLMYKKKNENSRFDVIDLDPYGTAVPFLDSAVQVGFVFKIKLKIIKIKNKNKCFNTINNYSCFSVLKMVVCYA